MANLSLARNADGRLEAFYIGEDGVVKHIWQLDAGNPTSWSNETNLYSHTDPNTGLTGALEVGATSTPNGPIHVVAKTDNGYFRIDQVTDGPWNNWTAITQS